MNCFLISKEGHKIKVSKDVSTLSMLIKEMIGNPGEIGFNPNEEPEIPLPNVDKFSLEKIVEFMEYYKENNMKKISKPLKSNYLRNEVGDWYSHFVDIDINLLINLMMSANYMIIEQLVELCCAKIVFSIKDKTKEQVMETFGIKELENW